jgi:hypothetical protein
MAEAVTHSDGVWVSLTVSAVLHLSFGIATILALRAMTRRWRAQPVADANAVYGPREEVPV